MALKLKEIPATRKVCTPSGIYRVYSPIYTLEETLSREEQNLTPEEESVKQSLTRAYLHTKQNYEK